MTTDPEARAPGFASRLLQRHARMLWTAALVLPLVWPKIRHAAGMRDVGTDGGQYVDVGRHLAEGDGFTTSLSVLHQGLTSFPHPTSLYPAWPMLMAALLQVFPLRFAIIAVPAILFFVVLLLADRVGRLISPARWPWPFAMFDGGHALVMCFVAAAPFFEFTSRPYTEALSFTIALLFLWRAERLTGQPSLRTGAELGLWLALLFYCRSQFVIFALALVCAGALEAALRVYRRDADLGALLRALGAAALTATLAWLPMYAWLTTFLENPGLGAYFRFDRARGTSYLTQIIPPEQSGLWTLLSDRLVGGIRAFDPTWSHSYYHGFGPLTYALPLALLAIVVTPVDARARLLGLLGDARRRFFRGYLLVIALGALASIHAVHKNFSYEWYFSSRHATVCVFAFFLAAMFALRSRQRAIAALAALLLLAGTGLGYVRAYEKASFEGRNSPMTRPMRKWLDKLPREEPIVIAADAVVMRRVAWQLPTELRRRLGVHTMYVRTTLDDLRAMSTHLGVRYFVVQDGSARARLLAETPEFTLLDVIPVPGGDPAQLLVYMRSAEHARAAN